MKKNECTVIKQVKISDSDKMYNIIYCTKNH